MQHISYYIVVPTVVVLLTVMFRRFMERRSAVRGIRGPPSPSFLLGLTPGYHLIMFLILVDQAMNTSFVIVNM